MVQDDTTLNYKFNIYDIRKPCVIGSVDCYSDTLIHGFLKSKIIEYAEGTKTDYHICTNKVFHALSKKDTITDSSTKLLDLLSKGLKVLVYAGEYDFMCNWIGNHKWMNELNWFGKSGFNNAKFTNFGGHGLKKCYQNLSFIIAKNSGHMVPLDQPEFALEMINSFTNGNLFDGC